MHYRYEIEHALAMLAPAEGSNLKIYTLRCSIGMKTSTLPLTSPCSGTKRKTTVPQFFASTGGLRLLSFMSILQSLQLFDFLQSFASPGLCRYQQAQIALFHVYTAIASAILFLQSFASPGLCKYRRAQIAPYYRPMLHQSGFLILNMVLTGDVCEGVLLCTYILHKNLVIFIESLYKSYKNYVKKSSKSAQCFLIALLI